MLEITLRNMQMFNYLELDQVRLWTVLMNRITNI